MSQGSNYGLVFVNDYKPGVGFRAVSRVQQPTVNSILGYVNPASPAGSDGAVVDPADWNGYIINYQNCGPGNYELVFLREGLLQEGSTYSFTTNAVFFSNRLQLLEAQIQQGTGGAQETEEGPQETEEAAQGTEEGAQGTEEGGQAAGDGTTSPEETATPTEGTATPTEETAAPTEETTAPTEETTTPPTETTTTGANETTTESVIVNATETDDGG